MLASTYGPCGAQIRGRCEPSASSAQCRIVLMVRFHTSDHVGTSDMELMDAGVAEHDEFGALSDDSSASSDSGTSAAVDRASVHAAQDTTAWEHLQGARSM